MTNARYNENIVGDITMTLVGPVSFKMPEGLPEFDNFPVMPTGDGEGVTGFIPGSSLRGMLRRSAVLPLALADFDQGNPWSLQRMYCELIGQDSGSEKESEGIDLDAIAQLRENSPILDLFGCGLSIKGRLLVGFLFPEVPTPPVRISYVRKDLDSTPDALLALRVETLAEFRQRNDANGERVKAESELKKLKRTLRDHERGIAPLSEEALSALYAAKEKLELDAEQSRANMLGMENSSLRPLSYWALPAGLTLRGKLVIDRPRDRDLDILTSAFHAISRRPIIGAHAARGCGEFRMDVTLREGDTPLRKYTIGNFTESKMYLL